MMILIDPVHAIPAETEAGYRESWVRQAEPGE